MSQKHRNNHRHSKHGSAQSIQSETDLRLHMIADKNKLKPIEKVIAVDRIDEGEETHMEDFHNSDSSVSFASSDSVSISSHDHRRSRPSRDRHSKDKQSKVDRMIEEMNRGRQSTSSSEDSSDESGNESDTSTVSSTDTKSSSDSISTISSTSSNGSKTYRSKPVLEKKEPEPIPKYTNEREKKVYKMELYYELRKYAKTRKLTRDYPATSSIEDMEDELMVQHKIDDKEETILLGKEGMKRVTKFLVSNNTKYDPFGFKLKGWDTQIERDVDRKKYDAVVGRLYDKYSCYFTKIEPEYIFIWMFFGSALVFHYTQKYIEENGLQELAAQHPEMVTQLQQTVNGFINKGAESQLNPAQAKQRKMGLNAQEVYQQMKEDMAKEGIHVPEQMSDDIEVSIMNSEASSQDQVENTINEMLEANTQFVAPPTIAPMQTGKGINHPGLPPRSQVPHKPKSVTNLLNNSNRTNVMTLSETPMIGVETVNNITEDTPTGKPHIRQRLSVGRRRNK